MKYCSKCNTKKELADFYSRKRGSSTNTTSWCKACLNSLTLERQRKRKKQAIEYKGGKCELCGYSKCEGALEFHHSDPATKEFSLSAGKFTSFSKFKKELDKCVLLCANCHREQHC